LAGASLFFRVIFSAVVTVVFFVFFERGKPFSGFPFSSSLCGPFSGSIIVSFAVSTRADIFIVSRTPAKYFLA
jgi:hypothetical protein